MKNIHRIVKKYYTKDDTVSEARIYISAFFIFGFLPIIAEYLHDLVAGNPPVGNVGTYWIPLGKAALAGEQIYTSAAINKPPIFQLLNIIATWTGHYRLIFVLLISTVNFLSAVIVYKLCKRYINVRVGFVAGLLYLSGAYHLNIFIINSRQFSVLFILLSFYATAAWSRALSISIAGLFTQFSIFAIPALLYEDYRRERFTSIHVISFISVGLFVLVISYGLIAIFWEPETAFRAFRFTFLRVLEYSEERATSGDTAWANFDKWLLRSYYQTIHLAVIAVFTVGYLVKGFYYKHTGNIFLDVSILSGLLLSASTMFRLHFWNYIFPLPFFAIVSSAVIYEYYRDQ